jgi:hypothetical protein
MLRRLTRTRWYYWLFWFLGRDEWSIELDGLQFRVVNHWIGPTQLLHDGKVLTECRGLIAVSGQRPLLEALVRVDDATQRAVTVYIKAIQIVKIRVEVNGEEISNGFV